MGKFVGQVDAEAVDYRDDRKSNERCDQAIFNGGGAGFVGQEFKKNSLQFRILSGCAASRQCKPMPFRNLRLRKFRSVDFMTNHGAEGDG